MKNFVTLGWFTVFGTMVQLRAQDNLVPNFSFEESDSCPNGLSQFRFVNDWFQPTSGTTDYFHACDTIHNSSGIIVTGIPNNGLGHQAAFEGQAYAGIYLRDGWFSNVGQGYREYIEVKLNHTLKAGKRYIVSFYYSQADSARIAVKSLGVYFSKDSLLQESYNYLEVIPQLSYDGDFIVDTSIWMQFSKPYMATGDENFLTIGNFKDDSATDFYVWGPLTYSITFISYIYIDYVTVSEDSIHIDTSEVEIQPDTFYLQPTLNQSIHIFYDPGDIQASAHFEVFNMLGQRMLKQELIAGETVLQASSWSSGCYVYRVTNTTLRRSEKFLIIK